MNPPASIEILQPPTALALADGSSLGPFELAEAPTWDAQAGRLWWADIEARSLNSLDFETGSDASLAPRSHHHYDFEQKVCSIGLTRSGRRSSAT